MTTHISSLAKQSAVAKRPYLFSGSIVPLLSAVAAFWPIWFWYCERSCDRSDEPLGILALITVLALSWSAATPSDVRNPSSTMANYLPLALVILYCCTFRTAPLVVQSIIAIAVITLLLVRSGATNFSLSGNWILLILSLPIVASLNFYLGYPLRIVASYFASVLLHLSGLAVRVQGAAIFWNGTDVSIDQPCSGIRMLWVALYLSATLASMLRLKIRPTFHLLLLSVVSAIVANGVRVSSLFYLESGIIKIDAPWHGIVHSGIGVAAFAVTAVILAKVAFVMSRSEADVLSPIRSENQCQRDWLRLVTLNVTSSGQFSRTQLVAFLLCCGLAAAVPFFGGRVQESVDLRSFRGWPAKFEGRPLHEQKLSSATAAFANQFPGCIAVFASDNRRVILRWVAQPTRQLHPAESCYRASGYEIKWLPQYCDADGQSWSRFEATKDGETLRVRERIFDEKGHIWTDVSAWYWAAVLQQSHAPWWSVCVVDRFDEPSQSASQPDGDS